MIHIFLSAGDSLSTMEYKEISPVLWTCDHVKEWLNNNNHSKFTYLFCNQHAIDGKALLLLTETDLRSPSLGIQVGSEMSSQFVTLTLFHNTFDVTGSRGYKAFEYVCPTTTT